MDFINLPREVVMFVIFPYVPKEALCLTNKSNWLNNYEEKLITPLLMEKSYYRFLIRKNLYFIFDIYLEYFIKLTNGINVNKYNKSFRFKNMIFSNRFDELVYFSKKYNIKNRCGEIISKNKDKMKNKFKKTRKKNVRWTN